MLEMSLQKLANIGPIGIPLGTCISLLGPCIRLLGTAICSLAFTIYGIRITDLSVLYSK